MNKSVTKDKLASRNIVILFDSSLNKKLIRLSRRINQGVPSKVVLNTKDMLPHLTVYGSKFPRKNLKNLKSRFSHVAKELQPFLLTFSAKSVITGTVFIDAELTEKLYSLHEKVVDTLNPLREGAYDLEELELPNLTEDMKRSLIKYGMLLGKKEYIPHVTVARPFDNKRCNEALGLLPTRIDFQTVAKRISLIEPGPNGTCGKIITTFKFNH